MKQREIALEIIYKSISDKSYTNLLMRSKLNELPIIQRPFVTNLVSGVLRNYDYLIYQVKEDINDKTSLKNRIIIAMALYEKEYLKEKDYVVNNEYVNLANNKYDQAFINAILRKEHPFVKTNEEYINHSLPKWLYQLLAKQYSETEFKQILDNYQRVPTVYYRINKAKIKPDELKGVDFVNDELFTSKINLFESPLMINGAIYVQDYNSASLYKNLDLQEDDLLLDVCSAPGSKLFNCLDVVKPINCYANDIHEKRVALIKKKAATLGFDGIHYLNMDGRKFKDELKIKFNKIMLDAPCSGLGTIGRKPDLKYHIQPESLDELQIIQRELLESVKPLLNDGGLLLYSTCTLNKKENYKQITYFLNNNPDFTLIKDETIINALGDCFYYALLKRI